MASQFVDGRSNGHGTDPHSASRGTRISISPTTPDHSPRFPNFALLKGPGERKITKDGQIQKRRGPKPDSKPAQNRRQELNRQAQRTHRERKEKYIEYLELKAVHDEKAREKVIREKNSAIEERDAAWREVERLRELLRFNGIPDQPTSRLPSIGQAANHTGSSRWRSGPVGSVGSTPSDNVRIPPSTVGSSVGHGPSPTSATQSTGSVTVPIDRHRPKAESSPSHRSVSLNDTRMTQVFIDFVLGLEAICHNHQQMLCERSVKTDEPTYHGHSLMISCPPRDHVVNSPGVSYPHKAPDLPPVDLMRLLEASDTLPLHGEITPVQALRVIRTHERFPEFTIEDLKVIEDMLKPQCRCYGFGAAVENFVVQDAIHHVLATKFVGFNFSDPVG